MSMLFTAGTRHHACRQLRKKHSMLLTAGKSYQSCRGGVDHLAIEVSACCQGGGDGRQGRAVRVFWAQAFF